MIINISYSIFLLLDHLLLFVKLLKFERFLTNFIFEQNIKLFIQYFNVKIILLNISIFKFLTLLLPFKEMKII
jgi:hypothetical protein